MPLPPPRKEKQTHKQTNETHYNTVYGKKTMLFSMCGDKDVKILLIPEVLGNGFVRQSAFSHTASFILWLKNSNHIFTTF